MPWFRVRSFGDKISPLSDTTNLAPAVTGTNLFDHIRNMLPTTVPSMLIALVIYFVVGFTLIDTSQTSFERIEAITSAFRRRVLDFADHAVAGGSGHCCWRVMKQPPIPSLFAGAVAGWPDGDLLPGCRPARDLYLCQQRLFDRHRCGRDRPAAEPRWYPVNDVGPFRWCCWRWALRWRIGACRLPRGDHRRDHLAR